MKPLITWFTIPLEPSDTTNPTNTLMPLNASESLPGKYGYEIATANSQRPTVRSLRVGWAVSGYMPGSETRPSSTAWNRRNSRRTTNRVITKINATVNSPGRASSIASPMPASWSSRKVRSVSPQGLV